ncbi:GA-like domain-containing protein, partial [Neisseria sp. P0016.S006]
KALNAKAAETKAAADEAVKALPADAKDAEGNTPAKLQARVDVLDGITVPAVTDANNNGIKDSDEAAIAGALEKVKAAEAAETAAEDALAKANKDGVISQQEADELKALNAKAAETKAAADEAVKALPADAKDAEGNTPAKLQARVDV